jgi:uncharacterized repeat protein (TIGR03803 family)
MRSHTAQLVKLFTTAAVASLLSLSPSVEAQSYKFEVLHAFHGKDGAGPVGVLRDASGNLYGTAGGGTGSCRNRTCGVAFKLNQSGKPIWVHSFNGGDGLAPLAGLLRDEAGNLYGTTYYGGKLNQCSDFGCGTVFKLSPEGRETVQHIFAGSPDGQWPEAPLAEDSAGNLYGTTLKGGKSGRGTVFR